MSKRYDLTIDGHTIVALAHNEDRAAVPLILIHGITSSVDFWHTAQTPIFNDSFPCYFLSLPGHYPAIFPDNFKRETLTPEMIANILTQAIRDLVGDRKVLLVGHSTGGFSALCIASYCPDMVAGLISVSGFAHGRWIGGLGAMQLLIRWGGKLGEMAFKAWYRLNQKSKRFNLPNWIIYAVNVRQMYKNMLPTFDDIHGGFSRLDLDSMVHYFSRMPDVDISDMLHKINAPTLALVGEGDPTVPPSQARIIAESVQNGELKILPKTGHLPMLESPEVYHEAITTWVQANFLDDA